MKLSELHDTDVMFWHRLLKKLKSLNEDTALTPKDVKYFRDISSQINSMSDMSAKDVLAHEKSVAILASMLSKELLIPINHRVKVTQAAKIHDIGKWIIPKEVLDADRELTSDERTKYVEKHPEIGAKMLIDAGFPNWLANLVRDHHREKNSGYPKIDDYLTFCAQILHVADVAVSVGAPDENHKYVHDASIKKALNVLEKPSFNQEIVDAFKRLVSSKKLPSIFKLQAA